MEQQFPVAPFGPVRGRSQGLPGSAGHQAVEVNEHPFQLGTRLLLQRHDPSLRRAGDVDNANADHGTQVTGVPEGDLPAMGPSPDGRSTGPGPVPCVWTYAFSVSPSANPRSGQAERSAPWSRSVLRAALSREQAEDTAALLRVVSDGARIRLLSLIHNSVDGSARVTDLTEAMGVSQPTVSRHLKLMTEAGILRRRPEGREVWYSIDAGRLSSIADLLR